MLQRSLTVIAFTSLAALAAATPADARHWRACGLRCVLDPTDDAAIYMVINRRFTHRLYDPTETVRNYPRFTRRLLDPTDGAAAGMVYGRRFTHRLLDPTDDAAPYMVHRRLRQPPRRVPLFGPADPAESAALIRSRAMSAHAQYSRAFDSAGGVWPRSHPPVRTGRPSHRKPR